MGSEVGAYQICAGHVWEAAYDRYCERLASDLSHFGLAYHKVKVTGLPPFGGVHIFWAIPGEKPMKRICAHCENPITDTAIEMHKGTYGYVACSEKCAKILEADGLHRDDGECDC